FLQKIPRGMHAWMASNRSTCAPGRKGASRGPAWTSVEKVHAWGTAVAPSRAWPVANTFLVSPFSAASDTSSNPVASMPPVWNAARGLRRMVPAEYGNDSAPGRPHNPAIVIRDCGVGHVEEFVEEEDRVIRPPRPHQRGMILQLDAERGDLPLDPRRIELGLRR